ncbi:helix-turn-helix transcriptional regulator [Flavobacterium alkalisoli]|uniref:Helix-turn-helix transcriptional regulator n=1 Tax=Flavobacterium alkalisoli TaxID=2602769 RepID=A0A5B9FU68_9FLAO|nr:helix-turn-helix transcriptional regulator [Flavobacterium alkalisoli]QEE49626.1 helix-turn-helix transcriptional regulator [Flavobacterium alkalisoli]
MKNFISENISYLVKENNYRQDDFGILFDLKKGVINQYIQGKSLPKIETLQKICSHFKITLDDLVNSELSEAAYKSKSQQQVATEQNTPYNNEKDAIIAAQRETIETQKELIATLRSRLDSTQTKAS